MKQESLALLLVAAVLAPSQALTATADRHPGIYQFAPISPMACAAKQRERRPAPRPERLQKLGDLPPAYVIRLAAIERPATRAFAAPGYDPCGSIERVK